jgi:hypothetical protein
MRIDAALKNSRRSKDRLIGAAFLTSAFTLTLSLSRDRESGYHHRAARSVLAASL